MTRLRLLFTLVERIGTEMFLISKLFYIVFIQIEKIIKSHTTENTHLNFQRLKRRLRSKYACNTASKLLFFLDPDVMGTLDEVKILVLAPGMSWKVGWSPSRLEK